jgi:hypothetical protein
MTGCIKVLLQRVKRKYTPNYVQEQNPYLNIGVLLQGWNPPGFQQDQQKILQTPVATVGD